MLTCFPAEISLLEDICFESFPMTFKTKVGWRNSHLTAKFWTNLTPCADLYRLTSPKQKELATLDAIQILLSGLLNIISSVGLSMGSTWRHFDVYGHTLHLENIENNIREMEVNISFLPSGIYFWEIRSKDEGLMKSGKILKQ